jgi:uncharacterized protein YjiS (DUF1127 family)
MSSISTTAERGESLAGRIFQAAVAAGKRWYIERTMRRMEREAIAQLRSMTDRELRDIGISRSQIEFAVTHRPDKRRDHLFALLG